MNERSIQCPKEVKAGDTLDVQLSPYGHFPNVTDDGTPIVQCCDGAAFDQVVANFTDEVLVDFEHDAETGGPTTAAAWVQKVYVDPDKGLMATFKLTDLGAEALSQRRLRFLSPVWTLDEQFRPERLISVGLTNKPNLPVRPLLNRAPGLQPVEDKGQTKMKEQLITALGLAPEATDEEILAAVQALVQRVEEADAAALNAEAEAIADENKDLIANREAFKQLYVTNRDAAKALLATLKPIEKVSVCNRAAAKAPKSFAESADADKALAGKWKTMSPGVEKDTFLARNKAAIQRGLIHE
jgi:phage I-like protein